MKLIPIFHYKKTLHRSKILKHIFHTIIQDAERTWSMVQKECNMLDQVTYDIKAFPVLTAGLNLSSRLRQSPPQTSW
mgnify:CR=1 FL=1